eukprot:sb/3476073/
MSDDPTVPNKLCRNFRSGRDCNFNGCRGTHELTSEIIGRFLSAIRGNNTEYRFDWEIICVKLVSSLQCSNGSPLALLSFSKLGMRCNMFISGFISKPFLSGYSHISKKRLCANIIIQLSN